MMEDMQTCYPPYAYMRETMDIIEQLMSIPDLDKTEVICEVVATYADKISETAAACRTSRMFSIDGSPAFADYKAAVERDHATSALRLQTAWMQLIIKVGSAPTPSFARTAVLMNMPAVDDYLKLYIGKTHS